MTEKLKPCPFCNAPALLEMLGDHHGRYYNLGCSVRGCLAYHALYTETPENRAVDDAIAAWNRRSPPSSADVSNSAEIDRAAVVKDSLTTEATSALTDEQILKIARTQTNSEWVYLHDDVLLRITRAVLAAAQGEKK